jgi:hypothetical protein
MAGVQPAGDLQLDDDCAVTKKVSPIRRVKRTVSIDHSDGGFALERYPPNLKLDRKSFLVHGFKEPRTQV